MFKSKPCSETMCTNPLFGGGFCKAHQYLRKDKKVKILGSKVTIKSEQIEEKRKEIEKQWNLFLKIWNDREHKSEVSSMYLGKEPLSIYFHHILPKEIYYEAKYDPENIILLTWEEHADVELNKQKFDIINEKRLQLLLKYKTP